MSAAIDSIACASSAASRRRVPRSHIEVRSWVSPALRSSSASSPPWNAPRRATTGTSRRGSTYSTAPLASR